MYSYIFLFLVAILNAGIVCGRHEEKNHGSIQHSARRHNRVHYRVGDLTTEPPQVDISKLLPEYVGLNFIYNSEQGMGGFANVTENVGISFVNLEDEIVKLIVDAKTGRIVRYKHLRDLTLIENKEFKGDILKVLRVILREYEYQNKTLPGESTPIKPSSEEGLSLLSEVFLHLGHPEKDSNYRSFTYLSSLAKKLRHFARGHLKGLLKGTGGYALKQNLNRFVTITLGLEIMFARAVSGLEGLLKKGVKFEFNALFNGKSGAEVFVYILRQTGTKFNIANIWGSFLGHIPELLDLIQLLGGGENKNGVDETIAIVSHFWAALTFKLPLTNLVQYLTEASASETWVNGNGDFSQIVKDLKNVTDEQARKYDNSGMTAPLVTFFSNLTANTLLHDNVNISDIVQKWRKRDAIGGMKVIIDIILKYFSPAKYNNLFFDSFLAFMNSSSNPDALKRLLPQVSLDQFTKSNESLWKQISDKFNIDSQLKNNSDPNQILSKVPGFGEFSKTFKDAVGSNFDFTKILQGGTISSYLSRNFLQQPVKWTMDLIKDSSKFIENIFWDPIKSLIPGMNHGSVFTMPTLPPIFGDLMSPKKPEEKVDPEVTTEKIKEKECEDDCDEKIEKKKPSTTTECGETTDDKPKPTKDECDDCEKEKEKKETKEVEEKVTEEPTEKPKEKECEDCEKEKTSVKAIEFKQHNRIYDTGNSNAHAQRIHHGHHASRNHESKHHESRLHEHHKLRHHHVRHHEVKHNEAKHHEAKHHEAKHHEAKHHEAKHHEAKHHEAKHHQPKHHEFKHHEAKHHEAIHHEARHHNSRHHEMKQHNEKRHEARHHKFDQYGSQNLRFRHHQLKHDEINHDHQNRRNHNHEMKRHNGKFEAGEMKREGKQFKAHSKHNTE